MRVLTDPTIAWLMEGDPSVRWQTMRDLLGASTAAVARERARVARDGWGSRLLAEQDARGGWAVGRPGDGGLYTPKWTSTTYTMLLLRDFGLPQRSVSVRRACKLLLDKGLRTDGGIGFGAWTRSETCVTGMVLSILSYFRLADVRLREIAAHLLRVQMGDGGWNCRRPHGATHSSVHTTISALEGLRWYELFADTSRERAAVRTAQSRGREFLLAHRLFRSHHSGRVIRPEFLRFVFPPRWHYDVLRALDYFQSVDAPRDARLAEAVAMVQQHRQPDGRWRLEGEYRGKTYFRLETPGRPSRWNTLRALRVLRWWEGVGSAARSH
ncbi:MAG: hypothetical protein U0132_04285 [Gemmatimonadaceae bacterium]